MGNRRRQQRGTAIWATLAPPSRAAKIANGFLLWYIGASLAWIVLSDHALNLIGSVIELPPWAQTVKGITYVTLFGFALRKAARIHVESVEEVHRAQIEANLELVRRLALAAEYRDDETGGHNDRIGRYSAIVGRSLGLEPSECEMLAYAASLHDIGKIGIPDRILLKNGALEPEERAQIQLHTELGAKILAEGEHPMVQMAHRVALYHHERWDGSGYPKGLRGTDIPVEGRIVAVCDVFDALTHCRPYKPAWTVEDAVREIEKGRGTHFDPNVVDAFLRRLPEIIEAKDLLTHRATATGYRAEGLDVA